MQNWKNIILLSLDALRADHLSAYGYHRDTSPVISDLAAESLSFTAAYSTSSHTRESVPSLLTGRPPANAVDSNYHLALNTDTLATRLSDAGFATAAFHSNPFLSRAYGFDRGFDTFDDDLRLARHKYIALLQRLFDKLRNRHYARAEEINSRALTWIDSLDGEKPFFLWNHYMDTHGPYEPPTGYRSLYHTDPLSDRDARKLYQRAINDPDSITDEEQQQLIDLYDSEIEYVDTQIGVFLDALEERGLSDDSLIILTSDHGDAFGEHGYYEHPRYVDTELVHVPLLLFCPNLQPREVSVPVSTADIATTALSAADTQPIATLGRNLITIADTPSEFTDRIVYSSARGEGNHSNLRRLSARSIDDTWRSTYDRTDDTFRSDYDDISATPLEEYISEYLSPSSDTSSEELDVNTAIEDRLSALGYK